MVSNGAIVDDSGQWYWNSRSWLPLVSNPSSKQPGAFLGKDRKDVAHLLRGRSLMDMGKVEAAGKDFAQLVSLHGDVANAEQVLISEPSNTPTPERQSNAPLPRSSAVNVPQVEVKTYHSEHDYERDARSRISAGWRPQATTTAHGKVNMGRTILKAGLFLPWAVMRPSRKGDPLTVTWMRGTSTALENTPNAKGPAVDILTQLERLGKLRDSGVLTEEEFQAQKERLLAED